MSARDDGGPAFPFPMGNYDPNGGTRFGSDGMTLRDYFAAKAMQAIWSNSEVLKQLPDGNEEATISKLAYEQADDMLKERNRG